MTHRHIITIIGDPGALVIGVICDNIFAGTQGASFMTSGPGNLTPNWVTLPEFVLCNVFGFVKLTDKWLSFFDKY